MLLLLQRPESIKKILFSSFVFPWLFLQNIFIYLRIAPCSALSQFQYNHKLKKTIAQEVCNAKKNVLSHILFIKIIIFYLASQFRAQKNSSQGNRTPVSAVRGRRLNRLTREPYSHIITYCYSKCKYFFMFFHHFFTSFLLSDLFPA